MMSRSFITVAAVLFGLMLATPALTFAVDDPACKPVLDAARKANLAPNHIYSTTAGAYNKNQPENSEMISTGGAKGVIYVMVKGKWTRSPLTPGEMVGDQKEGEETVKNTCRYLRDESVNGEAAAVYSSHSVTEFETVETTVWVSKSKGLILREDMDMDVGGPMGKIHKTMRYDYANVRPPAGVQ
jgi:hypothetical protein